MTDHDPNTPAGRVAIAIEGRKPKALADVRATDLGAVCAAVPADKADDVTRALALGAKNALQGLTPGAARRLTVAVYVEHLTHLLGAAA